MEGDCFLKFSSLLQVLYFVVQVERNFEIDKRYCREKIPEVL